MVRVRIGPDGAIEELTWEDWEERVRAGRVPPEALVWFRALTGDRWVRAADLEIYRSLRSDVAAAYRRSFGGGPPVLTALLVGFQLRVWWLAQSPGPRGFFVEHFTNSTNPIFEDGESWRLLTMGLLHTDLWHVILNMLWLAYTAFALERALGRLNLAVIYFSAVLVGAVLSAVGTPDRMSLGASGGVFGCIGAVVAFGLVHPDLLPRRGRAAYGFAMLPYAIVMFLSGLQNATTDNWSHFGGLVTGTLLGLVLDPPAVERRVGWNRRWHAMCAAAGLTALALPPLVGPRLLPLRDMDEATRIEASMRSPVPLPPEEPRYRGLVFDVPVGWQGGENDAGDQGFVSTAGNRAWAVTDSLGEGPADPTAAAEAWMAKLREGWPDARFDAPRDEGETRRVRATLPMTPPRVLDYSVRARGSWVLEEVSEVDGPDEGRLRPLFDRLAARVAWSEPQSLVEARAEAERPGASPGARVRYALERVRIGEVEPGVAVLRGIVEADPTEYDGWTALVAVARWYPDRVRPEETWAAALAALPTPKMVVEVAKALEEGGRDDAARGLLEIAWQRSPGDRVLARARRSRGMWTAIDATSGVPWELAVEPATGARTPIPAVPELGLAAAEAAGARVVAQRGALEGAVSDVLGVDAERAVELLLRLKLGPPGDDPAGQRAALGEDLASDEPPPWLSPGLFRQVAADPAVRALTAPPPEPAEPAPEPAPVP